MEELSPNVWLERCAHRITELDRDIPEDEARRIARELKSFERTAVMTPEEAVDFVASELSSPQRGRFERRASPRH